MGLVVTMSALVLGLLVSSAKASYDEQKTELTDVASKVIVLDRMLALYGPDTNESRDLLRSTVIRNLQLIWPEERSRNSELHAPSADSEGLFAKIWELSPTDDKQRLLQSEAANLALGLGQTRWLMYVQGADGVSSILLVTLGFWLTMVFVSFGVYAPRNATVNTSLFISAVSVSGAVLLIMEYYSPYSGLIKVSSGPLRAALAHLGQ